MRTKEAGKECRPLDHGDLERVCPKEASYARSRHGCLLCAIVLEKYRGHDLIKRVEWDEGLLGIRTVYGCYARMSHHSGYGLLD